MHGRSATDSHQSLEVRGRACSRPLCSRVADVLLLFEYSASHVALEWSPEYHDPNYLELCLEHAETFGPPQGWTMEDRRAVLNLVDNSAIATS